MQLAQVHVAMNSRRNVRAARADEGLDRSRPLGQILEQAELLNDAREAKRCRDALVLRRAIVKSKREKPSRRLPAVAAHLSGLRPRGLQYWRMPSFTS